jgi:hypothetical protein
MTETRWRFVHDRTRLERRAVRGAVAALAVALMTVPAMVPGTDAGAAQPPAAATLAVTVSSSELLDIACPSALACFAVGYTNDPRTAVIERWNGTTWSIVQGPNTASPVAGGLSGVACQNASTCFAVGNGLMERWNGVKWSVVNGAVLSPGWGGNLGGISCTSTFCLAVGSQSNGTSTHTLVERWNGSTWKRINSPYLFGASSPQLTNVLCRSASLCFAVGEYRVATRIRPLIERWNGTSWSTVASPSPAVGDTHLRSVACPSATSCIAVGYTFVDGFPIGTAATWVEHWNGTSWSTVASPNKGGIVSALFGVRCTSPTACIAVGEYMPIGTYTYPAPLVERWNGTAWSFGTQPNGGLRTVLDAVRCPGASLCFAVGHGSNAPNDTDTAMVARWDGTTWTVPVNGNP